MADDSASKAGQPADEGGGREEERLIAYCGLFCGTCGAYRRGRCAGCKAGGGYSSCAVRACCADKGLASCAECTDFADLHCCPKLNNVISYIFSVIFRSDRLGNLEHIRKHGPKAFVRDRARKAR